MAHPLFVYCFRYTSDAVYFNERSVVVFFRFSNLHHMRFAVATFEQLLEIGAYPRTKLSFSCAPSQTVSLSGMLFACCCCCWARTIDGKKLRCQRARTVKMCHHEPPPPQLDDIASEFIEFVCVLRLYKSHVCSRFSLSPAHK